MSPEEARQNLGLPRKFTQQDVERAYAEQSRPYMLRAQHDTNPDEREVAKNALAVLQDAYHKLTGKSRPELIKPSGNMGQAASELIRHRSLNGSCPSRHASPTRPRRQEGAVWGQRAVTKERLVAALIFVLICLVNLLLLSTAVGGLP
ncbi:MAG: hypothetical protein KA354_14350 [Phycisphaerae bacterium]|nr:hypothetical protein [Phycisphaerae bacterium]